MNILLSIYFLIYLVIGIFIIYINIRFLNFKKNLLGDKSNTKLNFFFFEIKVLLNIKYKVVESGFSKVSLDCIKVNIFII